MANLDREIHELPRATSVGLEALLAIEQDGEAQSLAWSLLRSLLYANFTAVNTELVDGATTITSSFNDETGVLTFQVPAQLINSYTKSEVDSKVSGALVPMEHVTILADQRLPSVLPTNIDTGRIIKGVKICSYATYQNLKSRGALEDDVLYLPWEED